MDKSIELQKKIINSNILNRFNKVLGDNDNSFLKRVYNTSFKIYENRLRAIGFNGLETILDAGCGFGQWSLVLSLLNKNVVALDKAPERLLVLERIIEEVEISNISLQNGKISETKLDNNSVDAIFCYETISADDLIQSLKEFYRILKPGGRLYFNASGLGYQLNLWLNSPNKTSDYNPRINVAKAFSNTVNYFSGISKVDGKVILDKEFLKRELNSIGFLNIMVGAEGEINLVPEKVEIKPFFKDEYFGFEGVFEFLATK